MGQFPKHSTTELCTHCGDICSKDRVVEGEHVFCCNGCAAVYTILSDNNLMEFYQLDNNAGRSQIANDKDYVWLDVAKLAARFIRFRDEERCHVELVLPTIHCASCLWLLERLPQLLDGVVDSRIDFNRKKATIVFQPQRVTIRKIAETLAAIGYPPHFNLEENDTKSTTNRSLIYRIGVAGFCFGNIMLLSFPEYFGFGSGANAIWFKGALGYLNIGLSIPVLFYAGNNFFLSAWSALKMGRTVIDFPIALGMTVLFGRSVFEIITDIGAGYLDSLSGLVFFLLIGRWFQDYTFSSLNFNRDYRDYFPIAAYREGADGSPVPIASEDIQVGDVLLIRPGQLIPADGTLLSEDLPAIDYSFVTGEDKVSTIVEGQDIFAGGRATSSPLRIAVTKPTSESYLLQLWQRESKDEANMTVEPPEWLVRAFTIIIILIAVVTLVYWSFIKMDVAYQAATSVLIIACPCALALAAPFAYGTLQRLLSRHGYYFRGPKAVRNLVSIDTYVFDKTGTLTTNGEKNQLNFLNEEKEFFNSVFLSMAFQSSHPKSQAFVNALACDYAPLPQKEISGLKEIPNQGLVFYYKGHDFRLGRAIFCGSSTEKPGTYASVDGAIYCSLTTIEPKLRTGLKEVLDGLGDKSKVWLLSGDKPTEVDFWKDYFLANQTLFGQSPFDKQNKIEKIKANGGDVLMIGDGINDTGALREADIGLAVNEEEAHFNPVCDGIVRGDRLALLPKILQVAKATSWVLGITYILALGYNIIGLMYAVKGALSPVIAAILMPLSSITIIVVATVGVSLVERYLLR